MDKVCLANYCLKQGKSDNRSSKMKNSDNDIRSRIKQTRWIYIFLDKMK